MKKALPFLLLLCQISIPGYSQSTSENAWWLTPQRMIQTNLREIDATMDIDQYIREVKEFGATLVLFNVGGIVANYPTELPEHWRNTHMEGDLLGTVLERLHQEGIRMIGRFDFSKVNEAIAKDHPEWWYISEKGESVTYNGQVHVCPSAPYQQEVAVKILGEVFDRYPQLDGIFTNNPGYNPRDYSGNYHGICQCEYCKAAFRKHMGMELPAKTDSEDSAYQKFPEFAQLMKDKRLIKYRNFLKARRSDICILINNYEGVDVMRKESNHALGGGTYADTYRSRYYNLNLEDQQLSNASVHFMGLSYRHAAVSPYLNARRNWQQMTNGGWLDFYCIGPLQRQEDRTGLDVISGIYNFHKDNETVLLHTQSGAEIGLVNRRGEEFDGIMQILCENHIPFDLIHIDPELWNDYAAVIVPSAGDLDQAAGDAIDRYVKGGGKVLLTQKIPSGMKAFGETRLLETRPGEKGSYVRIRPEDRELLQRPILEKLDLTFLSGEFNVYDPDQAEGVTGLLRLIPQGMFGPPEKCYYEVVSDHPALLINDFGDGRIACFTFDIGAHYKAQCHQGHANLFLGAMDNVLGVKRRLQVKSIPLVEVNHRLDRVGTFEWVSLYNHTGHNLNAFHAPIPVSDIQIQLTPLKEVKRVSLLGNGQVLAVEPQDGSNAISVTIPVIDHYDVVLFEY